MQISDFYTDVFHITDPELVGQLSAVTQARRIARGEFLVREGEPQPHISFLLSGILRGFFLDINGRDITDLGITERARLGISYGFQQPPRFKGLTVRNLLTIASGNEKLSKDQCCQYLTKVGLCANDYLDREVDASLSGGEVKRIEIATILARSSQLMIFDEPEAGIDLWSFARLTETFEQIHASGTATMIIISHQERIISLADEIIVVGDGELRHRGTPEEILPQILADTLSGCPVLTKEGAAV